MNVSTSGRAITLRSQSAVIRLEVDDREASLNGVKAWLSLPPTVVRGMMLIGRLDVAKVIEPVVWPPRTTALAATRPIVIDPGHGGNDNGTQSANGLREKSAALDVAVRLQQFLMRQGFDVTLTRTRDLTMPLEQRVSDARQQKAKLFVSIHFNSELRGRSARGIETYCLTPSGLASTASTRALYPYLAGNQFDDSNMWLAYNVQRSVTAVTGAPDRGVRRARFYVLDYAQCPAILVECGFLSNAGEANQVASTSYRELLAQGIGKGILNYQRTVE